MTHGFPAVWLRHNCPCRDCRDPVTGQRLVEITSIPNGLVATVTARTAGSVEVTFTPGGHRAVFSRAWLASQEAPPEPDPRTEDPESFDVLTGTPFPFGYVDKETELRACQPLIGLSPRGRVREVRLNNRSMLPPRLPAAEAAAAYAAYRSWAALVARPEFRLRLRLAPGDCLVFDNTRILHARTAFAEAGERHLQGCYADLDGLLSTLAVLRRDQ